MPASVVILAPNSFEHFIGGSSENQFQLITNRGYLASLINLDRLINSPLPNPRLDDGLKHTNPLAGYYLESFLKQRDYEVVTIFDWNSSEALERAMETDPIAVLFSTTYITDNGLLASCVQQIQETIHNTPLIVGGPYIWKQKLEIDKQFSTGAWGADAQWPKIRRKRTLSTSEEFERYGVDSLSDNLFSEHAVDCLRQPIYIANEFGEHTLLRVLQELESNRRPDLSQIPNLVLSQPDQQWQFTAFAVEPVDLNAEYTRWDLIDDVPGMVPIRTSIGCPFSCRFCDFIELHPRVKMRSSESLSAEIRLAKAQGRSVFNFVDDNIFLSKKRIGEITSAIVESEFDIRWGGFFRADRIDESNIDGIKASGCTFGLCGIESGDERMLDLMRKGCDCDEIHRGIELATASGINVALTFIVGFPGETRESVDNTIQLINSLSHRHRAYASYQVYPFYLLPGTAVDDPSFRAQFELTGRHTKWRHNTMSYQEAVDTWAPYMFRHVQHIPYEYYTNDSPHHWGIEKRNQCFEARRQLTLSFLDAEDDVHLQNRFAALFSSVADDASKTAPNWNDVLSDRSMQPGCRKPRERLGG